MPIVDALNARIRSLEPAYLPAGERFAERDWRRLLADEIHPSEEGYQVLADVVGDELARRELVAP